MRGGTARDTLVALLGEAKADEAIEAARDELAGRSIGHGYYALTISVDEARAAAEDVLAAVLPDLLAPEVITTREEADLLPNGAVVRIPDPRDLRVLDRSGVLAYPAGGEAILWGRVPLPMTVLYRPKEA